MSSFGQNKKLYSYDFLIYFAIVSNNATKNVPIMNNSHPATIIPIKKATNCQTNETMYLSFLNTKKSA
jgi:hypothetical protein